jgi:hypothetical protein
LLLDSHLNKRFYLLSEVNASQRQTQKEDKRKHIKK